MLTRSPPNLFEKYGNPESWAVITGGSDGIGLELCHKMAEQGFAICMVARNLPKMEARLDEIRERFPKIKTKAVVCDFGKVSTMAAYRALVDSELSTLDIGAVFLNAGMSSGGGLLT